MTRDELCQAAVAMLDRAYIPYSHFPVGAALECADGTVFTGCNIENASFSPTICAERTAFVKAVSEGDTDFEAIAIAGKKGDVSAPFSPCGVCRQVMSEFCGVDFKILVVTSNDAFIEYNLGELLPNSFDLKEE